MTLKTKITAFISKLKETPLILGFKRMPFISKLKEAPLILRLKRVPFLSRLSKRTAGIIASVLLLAVAGGVAYYKIIYLPNQTTNEPVMQTAAVRQGDLVIYASGTGTLIAADEVDLAFKTGGQVTGLFVKVSDRVETGDLLAQVDDTDAQIKYTQAKRNLLELTTAAAIASAQQDMAQAQIDLDSAASHLAYLISPSVLHWETEVVKAGQALEEAGAKAKASPSDKEARQELEDAEAYLDSAQDNLAGAQDYYTQVYVPNHFTVGRGGGKYVAAPTEAEILAARAAVAGAQASLTESQYLYAALTGDEVPEDATGAGLSELEQAKLDLQAAQSTLDGTCIYALISGTIMSIDTSVGDTVGTSAVITVADLSQPYLEIYLDETDWGKVAVDKDAEVTFDALPDETFTGKVTQVDPGLYTSGNTSMIRGLVRLDSTAAGLNLPLGSSAAVDVIGGQAKNAILVPIEALHETAPGKYAVFVVEDGKPRLRVVAIGIQDLLYAEVKSGLEAGDVVTTGITETQ